MRDGLMPVHVYGHSVAARLLSTQFSHPVESQAGVRADSAHAGSSVAFAFCLVAVFVISPIDTRVLLRPLHCAFDAHEHLQRNLPL